MEMAGESTEGSRMKNILITGGAGFIGSSLASRLLENDEYNIVLFDNLITGKESNIPKHDRCEFVNGDVNNWNDIEPVMKRGQFNFVFHYASLVGVQRTLDNPVKVIDDITGIRNVLDLSRDTGVERVFYSSSSEVYGEPVELPQKEHTTPLNAKLPYAIVKSVGEAICKSYQQEYGLNYTAFRFFNTYGPRQSEDFVISKFMRLALKNQDITVYGEGDQTRTFCYIQDNLAATISCMEEDKFVNDVINIGSDLELTILELAKQLISTTESKSKIIHLPALPEGDMTRRLPDSSNMKLLLNSDFIPLENGLKLIMNSTEFRDTL